MTGSRLPRIARTLLALVSASALPAHPIVAAFERFYAGERIELRTLEGGLLLLNELNCVACHEVPVAWRERLPGRGKISLVGVGTRFDAAALREFVREPRTIKPATAMPSLFHGDVSAADAMIAYLGSIKNSPATKAFPDGDRARGRTLYESIGCVACHAPADGNLSETSVPIGLAAHSSPNALAAFLQNPLHTRPAGRMPAFELSDREAADLAEFLRSGVGADGRGKESWPSTGAASTPVDHGADADGRARFVSVGCAACHDDGSGSNVKSSVAFGVARLDQGCMARTPTAAAPWFALSEPQSRAIEMALRAVQSGVPQPLSAKERVTIRFEQLNCVACHEWRGRGGPEVARAIYFGATDGAAESLGELGRFPPKLDAAGRKLTSAWLQKLLTGTGGGVRSYLTTRMPRFGEANAADLGALLTEACRPEKPLEIDVSGSKGHQRFATGRQLIGAGEGGLGCVSCHGLLTRNPAGIRAINLTATAQRVRPEYFKALLLDPQGVQPGTIMPPLFATRKNAEKEIESLWTYLKELDQNPRLPEGLLDSTAYELKPAEVGKPIVFRTFLEGAGTHAIAVGFPAGVHVAFDAFEVHWAIAWKGRFLDATSNWEERAMPPIRPLGDHTRPLPPRVALAKLGHAGDVWPTAYGTAAGYVFKGYRIGPDGVPVFRYDIGGFHVEDVLRPDPTRGGFRRTVTVRGDGDSGRWFFRGLAEDALAQPVVLREGRAIFEETLLF